MVSAFILGFAMLAPMLCVPPMEHILREELRLTHAQTSLLYMAPYLIAAAVAIPGGLIGDRIGAKKAAGIGIIIIAVGTVLRGTATDFSSLLAFTFVYGVGLGWSFPNLPKMGSAWFSKERAGVATGIFIAGQPLGMSVAMAITMPVIFPITNTFQGVFFIWSIPPIVAAIMWWILVKEPPSRSVQVQGETPQKDGTPFRQVLRNKNLWLVAILMFLAEFFFIAWLGWAPMLLVLKGATPDVAGLIASIAVWVIVANLLLMPRLAYKLGVRKPFIWVPSLILGLLSWVAIYIPLSVSWLLMALAGVANSTRYGTLVALPVEMMPREDVGAASGIILTFGFLGGAIGPYVSGHILDLTGNLDLSLLILAGISIATAGIALRLPETGPRGIKG